ncbi:hypothetical protein EVAR_70201_1 [Eumeta japonica]|uniref:Uncharacterized protein n=1 Tax=Eumeta variegata TaxID=151549 RepID=A0A4C1ZQG2_EUMVA|nr:hypothetical protein EVAR_70201_1 [Eumeta japonica]
MKLARIETSCSEIGRIRKQLFVREKVYSCKHDTSRGSHLVISESADFACKHVLCQSSSQALGKRRLENKNDPVLLAEYKEKERLKYLKKKEKGQRKCVKDMTPREHRKARKNWVAYSSDYRKKQKIQENTDKYANQNTPPSSEDEIIPEVPLLNKEREAKARRRSIVQRKKRNSILKRKDLLIENLKKKLASEQQKNRRLKQRMIKKKKAVTPKSKILEMAEDPNQKAELIKKALFGEVIQKQILDTKIETQQNKTCLKTILSSPLTHKYKIWRLGNNAITYKKMGFNRTKYEAKQNKKRVEEIIHQFYEDDNNSRCGRKECITLWQWRLCPVKLIMGRKEYRYAAICSKYDDDEGELTVTFLKVCNEDGTEFKINDNDIADVPYEDVIEKLPIPNLIVKRGTVFYKFKTPVSVYEK